MTDLADSVVSSTSSPSRGFKKGLPTAGLVLAETSAESLWMVARRGTTAKEAFAKQLGWSKASGNHWDTRIALLRGFKLIKIEGDQIGLLDLGRQLVNNSDPVGQGNARRTAVMNLKAYRELVDSYEGTELPETSVLAARLEFDYGKSEEFARKAAEAFVESIAHAKMLDSSRKVHRDGVPALADAEATVESEADSDSVDEEDVELDRSFEEQERQPSPSSGGLSTLGLTTRTGVSISVSLDLSNYRANEVIEILAALGSVNSG